MFSVWPWRRMLARFSTVCRLPNAKFWRTRGYTSHKSDWLNYAYKIIKQKDSLSVDDRVGNCIEPRIVDCDQCRAQNIRVQAYNVKFRMFCHTFNTCQYPKRRKSLKSFFPSLFQSFSSIRHCRCNYNHDQVCNCRPFVTLGKLRSGRFKQNTRKNNHIINTNLNCWTFD